MNGGTPAAQALSAGAAVSDRSPQHASCDSTTEAPSATLSVLELDASRLTIREKARDGDSAVVEVEGALVERFDPSEVEALFRAYAEESGQPLDMALLRETLANVSQGDVELPVRETVPTVLEGGSSKVCPQAPTP